jgi:hypothetical protein
MRIAKALMLSPALVGLILGLSSYPREHAKVIVT